MIDRHDFAQHCKDLFNELYQDFAIVYLIPIPETDQWIFTLVAVKNGEDKSFSSPRFRISRGLVKYSTWGQIVELLHSRAKSGYEYLLKGTA